MREEALGRWAGSALVLLLLAKAAPMNRARISTLVLGIGLALGLLAERGSASVLFVFSDINFPGLGAEAEFDLLNPTTLQVRFKNTSTGVPSGFEASDQILTGVSWDFDPPGSSANTAITGGSVVIGPSSYSVNFSTGSYGPGTNVSGEYGFGNMDGTGALWNFISGNSAQSTPFGGPNLDGPSNIDGPQGGLVADPIAADLGGLGAIQDEIIATVSLSSPLLDPTLSFLDANGVRVEFGSDAAFITEFTRVPEPSSLALLALAGTLVARRRYRA